MIIEEIKKIKSNKGELRKFGLTIGIVLGLLGGLFLWRGKDFYYYFLIPSVVLVLSGLIAPALLKPLHKAWMTLSIIMGWIMTSIILIILYYVILTPVSILARLVGKEFLDRNFKTNSNSYWIPKEKRKIEKNTYEKQF